jgi:hypothetical protein
MVYSLRLSTAPSWRWRGERVTKVVVARDESFDKRQHYEQPSARRTRTALAARNNKARRRERTTD